jgi:rhodanese-related sulfurtransferase
MKENKSNIVIGVLLVIVVALLFVAFGNCEKSLPTPEVTGGERGQFGIDKNINEETIDKYLGRSDSVYRDVRMLKDPANYEAIGGDSYLSGFVKGFEVVSLPYVIKVTGLPEPVGQTYNGNTLFNTTEDGKYTPNYKESMEILEYYFPKDKNIFLMCGAGGYAGTMKNVLISLGWDENKIYNVGGYWNYNGKNNVQVKNENGTYDFWKVTYHDINFNELTEVK